jgi:hypothetical protein
MVDLALLQSVSYIAGAVGVLVAAVFYILNMRETTRNRRMALTNTLLQNFTSEEGSRRWVELMQMEWKDFDDYLRKYDSSVNPDNYAKRNMTWNTCDIIGYQYLSGQLDLGTLWSICNNAVPMAWEKFGPIIKEFKRRGVSNSLMWSNFEYLAYEMSKARAERDPGYGMPDIYESDEYYQEFRRRGHPFTLVRLSRWVSGKGIEAAGKRLL